MKIYCSLLIAAASLFTYNTFCPASAGQNTCNMSMLKGDFGFAGSASIPRTGANGAVTFEPVNQVAVSTYDGAGVVSLKIKIQFHGTIQPTKSVTGAYTLNADCTGSAQFKDSSGTVTYKWDFVLVHEGKEIETMAFVAAAPPRPMFSMTFSQKKI